MFEYLTFEKFISGKVLIVFYYLFAVVVPVALVMLKNRILQTQIVQSFLPKIKSLSYDKLTNNQKMSINIILLFCIVMCEIFLRMFFEFLIAYMQMRDALVGV